MSTEGIDESLHGLGGIEEFPSKNGVFSRTQKLRFEKTRDSWGFSTRLDTLESLQRVMWSSRNNLSSRAQESTNEIEILFKESTRRRNSNRNRKPRGHKEGRASFPKQIQYKVSRSMAQILERSERTKRLGEKRAAPGEGGGCFCLARRKGERKGEGYL